jgi:hypothetical protein
VYKTGLEQGVWLENGAISRWTYNNITNTALKVGETAWAMQFVEHNRPYLEAAFQDSTYYFNRARCLYEMRDWGEALSALTRIDYDDVLQNLSARALQIKIYYHTEAWQALDSSLDSTAIYLRRKKVLGYHKESVQNFIRFMRRMLALPHGDRSSRQALHEEVAQCKAVAEKTWLLTVCSGT